MSEYNVWETFYFGRLGRRAHVVMLNLIMTGSEILQLTLLLSICHAAMGLVRCQQGIGNRTFILSNCMFTEITKTTETTGMFCCFEYDIVMLAMRESSCCSS